MTKSDRNRPYGIHTIHDLIGDENTSILGVGNHWVRAVPSPYPGRRLIKAWWVLLGRAEAVVWPSPGGLEAAANLPVPKMRGKQ